MATNAQKDGYKLFKYYEGLCSSKDFPKEIAKVLAIGVKDKAQKDIDGNVIVEPMILRDSNWDIVFPAPDDSVVGDNGAVFDLTDYNDNPETIQLSPTVYKAKILNQVNKITNTVILKTTTSPKEIAEEDIDDLTVDPTSNSSRLTMYLEIYKPTYVANPEEYPLDCEREGIVPQVITKEMYEDSYKIITDTEEAIYLELKEQDPTIVREGETPLSGLAVRISNDDYNKYVAQLATLGYSVNSDDSVPVELNGAELAKIKQENAILYDYFINNINETGIEPREYNRLTKVVVTFYKATDDSGTVPVEYYSLKVDGFKNTVEYTITKGTEYHLKHAPLGDNVTPEFYIDGIYIPLHSSRYYYDTANNKLVFDENIIFEENEDGVLVLRYSYDKKNTGDAISDRTTMVNNHYVLMRIFDNINSENNGPAENVYNAKGDLSQTNSHISPWAKLSWYRDFEEVLKDTLDTDIGVNSVQDGTLFVPLETPGLNADTKMRYWLNTNNDRFSLIVMGNPSLDYSTDRHLVSVCYCGAIDSFDYSINDTAGNFALFTSSSTEPCNTTLTTEKQTTDIPSYVIEATDTYANKKEDIDSLKEKCLFSYPYVPGQASYTLQADNKTYLNRQKVCRYIILDDNNNPMTALKPRKTIDNWGGSNGKYDSVTFYIEDEDVDRVDLANGNFTIYFLFHYYTEKNVITSGVTRDAFGNIVDVDKVNTYGANTSDGTTSIMMFHTRSKAYYQKHHMLFATTEEYMSKVMYGKSAYTGEYYADRIKVTHGNDGPRGTLSDLLVIDSCSLYARDELVINKDFAKDPDEYEETFVFFPITAPFSPLSDSPNATYGLAIKKSEVEPTYTDELILLRKAADELRKKAESLWAPTDTDIYPTEKTSNGCSVYWKVLPETACSYTGGVSSPSTYVPVKLVVTNNSTYMGNLQSPILAENRSDNPDSKVKIVAGSTVSDGTTSYLTLTGFEANQGESLYYGIADAPIESFGGFFVDSDGATIPDSAAQLKAVLFDNAIDDTTEDDNGGWVYGIDGVPYSGVLTTNSDGDIVILDATPEKYLVVYSAKESDDGTRCTISKFACLTLKDGSDNDNALLQYPITFTVTVTGGTGEIIYDQSAEGVQTKTWTTPFGQAKVELILHPTHSNFNTMPSVISECGDVKDELTPTKIDESHYRLSIDNIKDGTTINISFNRV